MTPFKSFQEAALAIDDMIVAQPLEGKLLTCPSEVQWLIPSALTEEAEEDEEEDETESVGDNGRKHAGNDEEDEEDEDEQADDDEASLMGGMSRAYNRLTRIMAGRFGCTNRRN